METTKVLVKSTKVKFFDSPSGTIKEQVIHRRMTIPEVKEWIEEISGSESVMLQKINMNHEFKVPTMELLKLEITED